MALNNYNYTKNTHCVGGGQFVVYIVGEIGPVLRKRMLLHPRMCLYVLLNRHVVSFDNVFCICDN